MLNSTKAMRLAFFASMSACVTGGVLANSDTQASYETVERSWNAVDLERFYGAVQTKSKTIAGHDALPSGPLRGPLVPVDGDGYWNANCELCHNANEPY